MSSRARPIMDQHTQPRVRWGLVLLTALLGVGTLACNWSPETRAEQTTSAPTRLPARVTPATSGAPVSGGTSYKWSLWIDGPQLRGANIYQRRVYPELDGPDFMGGGPIGPPYTQADLDGLAAMGANYVNISHPGLSGEEPPYALDPAVQENLDRLLGMAAEADLFAVISFRTGPGRSEFTFFAEEVGDWFDESYLNDAVWQDQTAQDGWAEMWRYTAERYRNNPIVVGYDLMVEPNANEMWLDLWEPDVFESQYAGTLYDWNQFFPRIVAAIRQVDADTPILVGGMSYSSVEWLPYLRPIDEPHVVYTVHQYAPVPYTHQVPNWLNRLEIGYPGEMDLDWDGEDEPFDRPWLQSVLGVVESYGHTAQAPMAVNEFGLMRWQPGAAAFMHDQMTLLEELGYNCALWSWDPAWEHWTEEVNAFNFRHGPDPNNHTDVETSELLEVIRQFWSRNRVRPSDMTR